MGSKQTCATETQPLTLMGWEQSGEGFLEEVAFALCPVQWACKPSHLLDLSDCFLLVSFSLFLYLLYFLFETWVKRLEVQVKYFGINTCQKVLYTSIVSPQGPVQCLIIPLIGDVRFDHYYSCGHQISPLKRDIFPLCWGE